MMPASRILFIHHILLIQSILTTSAIKLYVTDTSKIYREQQRVFEDQKSRNLFEKNILEHQNVDEAVKYGLDTVENLLSIKEPLWYKMGLFLNTHHPASKVAEFGKPNKRAQKLSNFGMASLEATRKIIESFPENVSRQINDSPISLKSKILEEDCPLRGKPRCPLSSKRYRTYDGTCNNLENPWRGASLLPMQRFLPPVYEDGIQSIRRSILGTRLPSAREISTNIHKDKDQEVNVITLMFMQWGQFIDHDITSVVKSRGFNGSVPRCCDKSENKVLPEPLLHPSCLPIEVPEDDWFFSKFKIGCMEFLRSAPSTRINCDLGWREQINQATSFIDGSMIYGNDLERADSIRTFRQGKIFYGRPLSDRPLQPPDPPGGELCNAGALTTDCFQPGDGRVTEQPGLTALHTVWIRYHNQVAAVLSRLNSHWSDEKTYQETRKIIYSLIQHITYNEFLPILLGPEVLHLFELELGFKGFYKGYDTKINPMMANAFSTAAYRFGHSMVQNSFIRTDRRHRPIFNNVSLHEEFTNFENIWSFGSVDRTILGFCNQPAQRRDEFICDELSNHLFQPTDMQFGMDLAAINIQRGRDHGIPPYTSWREPCGLTPIKSWNDLKKIFSVETTKKFRKVYRHADDIDLFSGGLAEKPVKGAVVGPTFACIIAQQFVNLRKGDRFWYENGEFISSFTPAQLQQIRRATLSSILCQTMDEIETIQPFSFLSPDTNKNSRLSCKDPILKNFDLSPWIENVSNDIENRLFSREGLDELEETASERKRKTKLKYKKPKPKPETTVSNTHTVIIQNTKGSESLKVRKTTERPFEVNIKIEYYPTKTPSPVIINKRGQINRPTSNYEEEKPVSYPVFIQSPSVQTYNKPPSNKPTFTVSRPTFTITGASDDNEYGLDNYRPPQMFSRPSADSYSSANYRPSANTYNSASYRPSSDSYNSASYRPSADSYSSVSYRPAYDSSSVSSRPNNIYDGFYDRPSGYDRPSSSFNNPVSSYDRPGTPYNQPSSSLDYDEVIFEDRPFATSNKPNVYRPNANHHMFNQIFITKRPVQSTYDDDIQGYFYKNKYDKETSLGQDRPIKVYSTGYVQKLHPSDISDKLDFKSHLVNKNDNKLIKISSIKSHASVSGNSAIINAVLQREGDEDIIDEESNMLRLVDLDVAPSENNDKSWLLFEESKSLGTRLSMPHMNIQTISSDEIPRPLKSWNKE
ncbi:heme peroxidase 2-like [Diabrotica virgifera virgifera]|uniref:Thyroid peroxidase-like n=1 Tax=Diabrotica virgifera virgifera TaxID=50390 RepID=A0A6P7EZ62_DIAVI|nr:heme peroxidase 2-like [Diabrotica virgifera virgifera]